MRIKTKYFETFKTLFYLLDKNSQKESVKSLIYILISAFLDIFSIATIIPLILLVLNPEIASQNRYFISIISFLNISTINFIRFLLVFIVLFFIVKNLLNIKISEFIAKYTYKIVTEISEKALIKFYISDFQDIANKSSSIIIREIFEAP
ncbi:MAG: hypothetical protein JXA16_08840, partial [Bacteroidales bacterium]|nr:hypothetical protein [Bacteroidales bacterium]